MRFLVTSTSGLGHLLPVLPIAEAAAAAGHDVLVSTPAQNEVRVRAAGLAWHELPEPTDEQRQEVWASGVAEPPLHFFARLNPLAALPALRAVVEGWKPDLVVSEGGETTGAIAAELTGVPAAIVHPGLVHANAFAALMAPLLGEVRASAGLDPAVPSVPDLGWFPALLEPVPTDTFRARRPGLPTPGTPEELIFVTFGTEISRQPMFVPTAAAAIAAARSTGCEVVVAVGQGDASGLDADGVDLRPWVDQAELLPRCRAVIHHGGAGTTLDALAAGTPSVIVPFFADQAPNAAVLEAAGAGVTAAPGPDLEGRIAAALQRPQVSLSDAVHALPPVSAAIAHLEGLVRG